MTYKKGEYVISVQQIDSVGKYPGLYIGKENELTKVSYFHGEDKAKAFCEYLEYFMGIGEKPGNTQEGKDE